MRHNLAVNVALALACGVIPSPQISEADLANRVWREHERLFRREYQDECTGTGHGFAAPDLGGESGS